MKCSISSRIVQMVHILLAVAFVLIGAYFLAKMAILAAVFSAVLAILAAEQLCVIWTHRRKTISVRH